MSRPGVLQMIWNNFTKSLQASSSKVRTVVGHDKFGNTYYVETGAMTKKGTDRLEEIDRLIYVEF